MVEHIWQERPTFIQTDTHSFLRVHRPDCEKRLGCCGIAAKHLSCLAAKPQRRHCVVAPPQRAFSWAPLRHLAARYCWPYSASARPPQLAVLVRRALRDVQRTLHRCNMKLRPRRDASSLHTSPRKRRIFMPLDDENV